MTNAFHSLSYTRNSGQTLALSEYAGKVLLIVNTASKCGFTPQYEALESVYNKYKTNGFEVIGFPCDQFGGQEPGSDEEIEAFCQLNFGVSFPLSQKIEVNGENTHPIYTHLKKEAPGILGSQSIKWNFTKFLVGRDGKVIKRYASATKPSKIEKDIELALSK